MFWNIYWKRIIGSIRNKELIIWTLFFPLMLSTLFFAVFSNIDASGLFREVPIGVVDNEAYRLDVSFQIAIGMVSGGGASLGASGGGDGASLGASGGDGGVSIGDGANDGGDFGVADVVGASLGANDGGDFGVADVVGASLGASGGGDFGVADAVGRLFDLRMAASQAEADEWLEKGEIDGYVVVDDAPMLVVSGNGIGQTIAKSFLDRYLQTKKSAQSILSQGPEEAIESLPALLERASFTEEISLSQSAQTRIVNYFYALLAMVCMYGGFQGLQTMTYLQANLSPLGARNAMAPVGRLRMVAYDLLGGATIQYLCLLAVVAYVNLALGVSFGPRLLLVLLVCLAGCVLGVSFGAMVSVMSKLKEQAKVAILITVTMVSCFLSGLMVGGINYTVAQSAPAVAWLNPAARITDAFYCLYYYDTYERYFLNIGIILAMAVAMLAVTVAYARRQRYESI